MSSNASDFESDTGSFPATPSSGANSDVTPNSVSTIALNDARKLKAAGRGGQALAFYLIALQSDSGLKVGVKREFAEVFKASCDKLEESNDMENLFHCFKQASSVFPECEDVFDHFGSILYKFGYISEAIECYRKALSINGFLVTAKENLDNIYCHLVDRWHFLMLNDQTRNSSFKHSIHKAIAAGCKSVLDIGSGTGILSIMAVKCGASQVYACEENDTMYELSKDVLSANLCESRVQLINKNSSDILLGLDIPQRVDLIVTETLDCGVFGEGILSTLSHALTHLLASGSPARVIPARVKVFCTVIECQEIRKHHKCLFPALRELDLHDRKFVDVTSQPEDRLPDSEDYDPYTTYNMKAIRGGFKDLTEKIEVLECNFTNLREIDHYLEGHYVKKNAEVILSGQADAIMLWFDLSLDETTKITSDPHYVKVIFPEASFSASCWHPAIYPLSLNSKYLNKGSYAQISVSCANNMLKLDLTQVLDSSPPEDLIYNQGECNCGDSNSSVRESDDKSLIYYINSHDIYRLNDLIYNISVCEAVKRVMMSRSGQGRLLDMSKPFSTLAIQGRRLGASESVLINPSEYHKAIIYDLARANHVDNVQVLEGKKFDCVVTSLVEPDGTLSQHILEDIALAKLTLLTPNYGRIVPGKLRVFGMCINSDSLLESSCVVNNTRTSGIRIASFINQYQVSIQRDIDLSTLEYTRLTEPTELITLDFNSDEVNDLGLPSFMDQQSVIQAECTHSDRKCLLNAVVYWFELALDEKTCISTLDAGRHWKQAAVLLQADIECSIGDSIEITSRIVNGCLSITAQ